MVDHSDCAGHLVWESYPYFPSGKIIVGDMQTALWIFRFSELPARVRVHLLEPLNADTVDSAPSMVFRWTRTADMNNDPHWYEVQLKGSGVDTSWKVTDITSLYSNPVPTIKYQLWTRSHLVLTVHNQLRPEIRRLVDAEVERVSTPLHGWAEQEGLAVASGTYYVRAKANGFVQTVKVLLS